MEFQRRLARLLENEETGAGASPPDPATSRLESLADAMHQASAVLERVAETLSGAEVSAPGSDPVDPSFYVASLQIPKLPNAGFAHPVRLYFVGFPVLGHPLGIRMARAIAMGEATNWMSLRKFLQSWNQLRTGGVVVYEGAPDPAQVRIACEQAILRFLERRAELFGNLKPTVQGQVRIWPVDPNFKPRICAGCLLPLPQSSGCLRCGKWPS